MNTFTQYTKWNRKFLAVPIDAGNVAICDNCGNNYGSYQSFESFVSYAERNGGFEKLYLGSVVVKIVPTR